MSGLVLTDGLFGVLFLLGLAIAVVMPPVLVKWSKLRRTRLSETFAVSSRVADTHKPLVITSPGSFRALTIVYAELFVILGFCLMGAVGTSQIGLPFFAAYGLAVGAPWLLGFRSFGRFYFVTDQGITRYSTLGHEVTLRWDEVDLAASEGLGCSIMSDRGNIRMHWESAGYDQVVELIETKVPSDRFREKPSVRENRLDRLHPERSRGHRAGSHMTGVWPLNQRSARAKKLWKVFLEASFVGLVGGLIVGVVATALRWELVRVSSMAIFLGFVLIWFGLRLLMMGEMVAEAIRKRRRSGGLAPHR